MASLVENPAAYVGRLHSLVRAKVQFWPIELFKISKHYIQKPYSFWSFSLGINPDLNHHNNHHHQRYYFEQHNYWFVEDFHPKLVDDFHPKQHSHDHQVVSIKSNYFPTDNVSIYLNRLNGLLWKHALIWFILSRVPIRISFTWTYLHFLYHFDIKDKHNALLWNLEDHLLTNCCRDVLKHYNIR